MKINDLHNDLLTSKSCILKDLDDIKTYAKKVVLAIYQGNRNIDEINYLLEKYKKIKTKNIFLAFEDINFMTEKNIEYYLSFNPLYLTPTWNIENSLGYGCDFNKNYKNKGKKIIEILNKKKFYIDTAHSSEKSFNYLLDNDIKILNSHTGFFSMCKNNRNIKDYQIKEIINKKSIIGLCFVGKFVTENNKNCDSNEIIKNIDYFVQKFGDNSLCFGTDFNGTIDLPKDLLNYENCFNLVEKLFKIGYNDDTIKKIFYKNIDNFIQERQNDRYEYL